MSESVKLPENTARIITKAFPRDTNPSGEIFVGWIMSQVAIAGVMAATERAKGRVVMVAAEKFSFEQPVHVGDDVNIYAEVARTGRTSITVRADTYVVRDYHRQIMKVSEATLVYVAVYENGSKRALPSL